MKETGVSLFTKVGSYSNDVFPSSAATMLTNLKALITHLKHTTALQFQQKVRNTVIQHLRYIW